MRQKLSTLLPLALMLTLGACGTAGTPTGVLQVTISGLPGDVEADVTVSGLNGFSQNVSDPTTLRNLSPGGYQVTAKSFAEGGDTYLPDHLSQNVTVEAGKTATVSIIYTRQAAAGSLIIDISGLPDSAEALVTASGPEGFTQIFSESATVRGLTPGEYTVTAIEVDAGDETYVAQPTSQSAQVEAGKTAKVSVLYSRKGATTGSLNVVISGLSGDVEADVTVGGPQGFIQTLTKSMILSNLAPGVYTVTATEARVSPYTYAPNEAAQSATIEAGRTTRVTVGYAAITGAVAVTISGLPSGALAPVTFAAADVPDADPALITASTTLEDVTPGNYEVSAAAVTFDGFHFEAETASSVIEVDAGNTVAVSVAYRAIDGKLLVVTEGLPGNVPVTIGKLSGPGLETPLEIDTGTFLKGLEPGSYEITERLQSTPIDGVTYVLEGLLTTLEVQAGEITTMPVRFVAQQGDLRLVIRGLPGSGLPSDFEADVVVTGPNGFNSGALKHGTTLFALEPGVYTVSASDVPAQDRDFIADPHEQTATVVKGETVSATVEYSRPPVVCCGVSRPSNALGREVK